MYPGLSLSEDLVMLLELKLLLMFVQACVDGWWAVVEWVCWYMVEMFVLVCLEIWS